MAMMRVKTETTIVPDDLDEDVAQVVHRVGIRQVDLHFDDGAVVSFTRIPDPEEMAVRIARRTPPQ